MLYRLVQPMKRSGSSVPQFSQRIPADVRAAAIGRTLAIPRGNRTIPIRISRRMETVRFSLRTTDPSEVKMRQAAAASYLQGVWRALRTESPRKLNHREATALAGELYRAWADGADRERTLAVVHTPQGWRRDDTPTADDEREYFRAASEHLERVGASGEPEQLEQPLGPLVDRLLLAKGIASVDAASRRLLLPAFWLALKDAMGARERNAAGDYSPDHKAQRFPAWEEATSASKVPLKELLEDWWTEARAAGRKPSTYESYSNTIATFITYLKHDDAARIKEQDVIGFKDHRLSATNPRMKRPVSAKTVKGSDLTALKTILGWAVANRRLRTNAAAGVTIKLPKRQKLRQKHFTPAEAKAILSAASAYVRKPRESERTAAAKRWVPWLCAYTGARVGEPAQLRKKDPRREGRDWVITITPEAGTVKTDEARDVVLHPHLIAQGFAKFVRSAPDGHLFIKPSATGGVLGPLQAVKNRLQEFVREIVPDRNVAPNHGWRHWFKTVGMEAGVAPRILDAIQGHAPSTVGDTYGDVTVRTMADAMRKFPRIKV